MRANKSGQKVRKEPRILICDIIITIQAVVIVIIALALVWEITNTFDSSYAARSFHYDMQAGRYDDMVEMYHYNEARGYKVTDELSEYYGVARYYEAASLYKAYLAVGNEDEAERCKSAMEEAAAQMGAFAPETAAIETQLGF